MNEIDEAVPQLKFYEEVGIQRLPSSLQDFNPTALIQIRSGQGTVKVCFLSGLNLTFACGVLFQIRDYEKLDSEEERLSRSRQIYDGYIMKELLSCSHVRVCTTSHVSAA